MSGPPPALRSPTAWGDVATVLASGVLPAGAAAADFALCRQNRLRHPFGEISRPTSGVSWPGWLQRDTEAVVRSPLGGRALVSLVGQFPSDSPSSAPIHSLYTQSRIRPQSVHTTLMLPPATRLYGVRAMGQTPIYEQLRGERINVEVPATGADPQRVDHPGKHRLLAVAPVPAAVFEPPASGTDLDGNQHHLVPTSPAGQPAGDGQWAVAVGGPRAGRSLTAPVPQAPAHAASSAPALPGSSRHCAARGAAAGEHGAHRRQGGGLRPDQRSEPRPATRADAQFRWFEVDHDTGDSSAT